MAASVAILCPPASPGKIFDIQSMGSPIDGDGRALNRLLAIAVVGLWLIAFVSLLTRDVLPYWQAQDPPRGDAPAGDTQLAILGYRDHRIGTSWTTIRSSGDTTRWESTTALLPAELSVPLLATMPPVLFDTTLTFQKDG